MENSTKRARRWMAEARPLLTWAPLVTAEGIVRHAWYLPPVSAVVHRGLPSRTACGLEAECPHHFTDDSRTQDCEACRDKAAGPFAALLDEVRADVLRELADELEATMAVRPQAMPTWVRELRRRASGYTVDDSPETVARNREAFGMRHPATSSGMCSECGNLSHDGAC
jgi:hypothetical protein